MNAREELFETVWQASAKPDARTGRLMYLDAFDTARITDGILADGYVKPRTVTTIEELDRLGVSAAVLAANGAVWVNDGDTEEPWASIVEDFQGGPLWANADGIDLPATVLHEGGAA